MSTSKRSSLHSHSKGIETPTKRARISNKHNGTDNNSNNKKHSNVNGSSSLKASQSGGDPFESTGYLHASAGEAYLHGAAKSVITSDNRLSERLPRQFTSKLLSETLQDCEEIHSANQDYNNQVHRHRFQQWYFELIQGYSLLFYGLGSKLKLLNNFANTLRPKGPVIVLEGFNIRAPQLLPELVSTFERLCQVESSGNNGIQTQPSLTSSATPTPTISTLDKLEERAIALASRVSSSPPKHHLFLVVHNIDATSLRFPRAHVIIAILSNIPLVHLIASVDHVHSSLLFPALTNSGPTFKFLHHHVSTFNSYLTETQSASFASTLLPKTVFKPDRSASRATRLATTAESARYVLASIPSHAKRLLNHLVQHQLSSLSRLTSAAQVLEVDNVIDDLEQTPFFALPHSVLLAHGRENFFASSANVLDALLQELRDHEIVLASEQPPAQSQSQQQQQQESLNEEDQGRRQWLWIGMPRDEIEQLKEML